MGKEYRHLGFASDAEFIEHHMRRAAEGDENSQRIIRTRTKLDLMASARAAMGKEQKDDRDVLV